MPTYELRNCPPVHKSLKNLRFMGELIWFENGFMPFLRDGVLEKYIRDIPLSQNLK